ncbi:hypothetical protein HYE69_02220 [Staphylococcus sp. GSSP0090]|nr:hypothetical protein [Staphylococcus sp. GSSP0090]
MLSYILYPLITGMVLALIKVIDLWIAKKVLKGESNKRGMSYHWIWILFIVGAIIGLLKVMIS